MSMHTSHLTALAIAAAAPALAAGPPGPAPWICHPHLACDAQETCVRLPNTPSGFSLTADPQNDERFVADGMFGDQRIAQRFQSMKDASNAIRDNDADDRLSMILLTWDGVADAHGFRVLNVARRGTGELIILDGALLISCNSMPRR